MNILNHINSMTDKTVTIIHIAVAFLIALSLSLYFWVKFPHVIFLHEADGIGYIAIARNIIENFSCSNATHAPPFYPAVVAIFALLSGNYETGSRLASVVMGSAMVVPFYLACRYLMTGRAAFCAALLAAVFGPFIDYSVQPISQSTYICMIAVALWLGLRYLSVKDSATAAFFGLSSVAIYLTRPEGILLYAVSLPLLIWITLTSSLTIKTRTKNIAGLLAGFGIPFIWYVFLLNKYLGIWGISGKSTVTMMGIDASMKIMPDGRMASQSATGRPDLFSFMSDIPAFLKIYASQTAKFSSLVASSLPALILIASGVGLILLIAGYFKKRDTNTSSPFHALLFLTPLTMLLPVMAFDKISVTISYIMPLYIIVFALSALAFTWTENLIMEIIARWIPVFSNLKKFIPLTFIAVIILWVTSLIPLHQFMSSEDFQFMADHQAFILRDTGHWFRENTNKENTKLMTRWSNVAYYGERKWAPLADGSIDEVIRFSKNNSVTHIVIDSDSVPRRRPKLENLLNPSMPHSGLVPVYAQDRDGARVVIYQVF